MPLFLLIICHTSSTYCCVCELDAVRLNFAKFLWVHGFARSELFMRWCIVWEWAATITGSELVTKSSSTQVISAAPETISWGQKGNKKRDDKTQATQERKNRAIIADAFRLQLRYNKSKERTLQGTSRVACTQQQIVYYSSKMISSCRHSLELTRHPRNPAVDIFHVFMRSNGGGWESRGWADLED